MGRHLSARVVRPKMQPHLAVLKLSGFVNAATVLDFERTLDSLLLESRLDLVIDLAEVGYMNSTGISALLTYHQSWKAKGDELALVRVPRPLGLVLEQLGVPAVVPVLADEPEAVEFLARSATGQRPYASIGEFLRKTGRAPVRFTAPSARGTSAPAGSPPPASIDGKERPPVLVVDPEDNLFTEVLRLRYNGSPGRFHLVHSCVDALRDLERVQPNVIILRDTATQADEFVSKVKIERGKSLVSVIKVYASGSDPARFRSFKIWENDFFVEPFDVAELYALTEMELKRVSDDRRRLSFQTLYRFSSTEENLERATQLMRDLLARGGLAEDTRTSLFAAFKEALDNAVRHGNRHSPSKPIEVIYTVDSERVTVEVADEGQGFDFASYLDQLKDEEAYVLARKRQDEGKRGGLGILMMHKCADALEYLGSGNRVRLRKNLPAS